MSGDDLKSMSIDELWAFHEHVTLVVRQKLEAEKTKLVQRLNQLQATNNVSGRRPYPRVPPKYRNPSNPAQVWSGRGKRPLWLEPQIRAGKGLDDFLIEPASAHH
jgi:DNA-binding protein H-NS